MKPDSENTVVNWHCLLVLAIYASIWGLLVIQILKH